ncbi:zinc finger protein ZAT12-like [Phragmites australis]|uniref:zinc finger protein ZAT12-like n=1 Tax=Phragmites australis TaxID=29695 RepID=UPI002D7A08C1|nr:zinc finger protein ZAT12-like [Phragmites australis]
MRSVAAHCTIEYRFAKSSLQGAGEMETGVDAARLLVLLSQQQQRGGVGAGDVQRGGREFECKTCGRRFPTFQALGGHRASHRRPRPYGAGIRLGRRTLAAHEGEGECVAGPRVHGCPVCGVGFAVGQALGGHMRRHRTAAADAEALGTGDATSVKDDDVGADCNGGICLDLNLAPSENCAKCRKNAVLGDTEQGVQKTMILDLLPIRSQ